MPWQTHHGMLTAVAALMVSAGGPSPTKTFDFTLGSMPSGVTFSRTTQGTYINSSGLLTLAAVDAPRLDYDLSTLTAKGLLIEPAATNLALQSGDLANAAWSTFANGSGSVGRTANSGVAPDGTTTAAKIDLNRAASSEYAEIFQNITLSGVNTASLYFKAFAAGDIGKQISVAGFTSSNIGTVNVTLTASWQRVPVTFSSVAASTSVQAIFGYLPTSTFSTATTQTGVVSFYVSAVQVEAGSVATSYIPTTSAAVARAADVASVTGTNFSSWYNQSEGTFANMATAAADGAVIGLWNRSILTAFQDGNNLHAIAIGSGSDLNKIIPFTETASSFVSVLIGPVVNPGTQSKAAYAYKANDFAASINGGSVLTDTSGGLPTPTALYIGSVDGSQGLFHGYIKKIDFYNTRLSDANLQAITT